MASPWSTWTCTLPLAAWSRSRDAVRAAQPQVRACSVNSSEQSQYSQQSTGTHVPTGACAESLAGGERGEVTLLGTSLWTPACHRILPTPARPWCECGPISAGLAFRTMRTTRNNNRTDAIKAPQLGSTSRRKHTLQQGCAFSAYACALADPAAQAELVHALPLLSRVCWETSTRRARLASAETSMQRTRLASELVHALPQYCWETSTRRARLASSETSMQRTELADCGWTQV